MKYQLIICVAQFKQTATKAVVAGLLYLLKSNYTMVSLLCSGDIGLLIINNTGIKCIFMSVYI